MALCDKQLLTMFYTLIFYVSRSKVRQFCVYSDEVYFGIAGDNMSSMAPHYLLYVFECMTLSVIAAFPTPSCTWLYFLTIPL